VVLTGVAEVVVRGMERGLHVGAQVYVSVGGKTVMDEAFGRARLEVPGPPTGGGGAAMRTDTLLLWLSAGKPVTAVAIGMLAERGKLGWDDAVVRHIPEFATPEHPEKAAVTIRHLLTHTGGFRVADLQYPFLSWDETIAKICAAGLERGWTPGKKAGYHAHSSWYMLGEIIRRVDGRACEVFLREEVFEPLGMTDTWLAMGAERFAAYGERMGVMYDTTASPRAVPNIDTVAGCGRPRPSGSVRGPVRELGRFYEELLRVREGGSGIVSGETVRVMTSRQRVGMFDVTFRQKIDWGLGFVVNSARYGAGIPYQFGPYASEETFGHGGNQSSVGMCDPERKLVVTAVFNGWPGEAAHDRRLREFLGAVYEELGLAGG
jgi:CubicO group peptidase (beta-lactamase class C family)